MPALDNPKHEAFAQAVALGMSATQAYRTEVSEEGCLTSTAMSEGCRLLGSPKVSTRVEELRKAVSKKAEERFGLTAETLIRLHLDVIETPLGEVDKNSRLAQEYKIGKDGITIKTMPKASSAAELAKLCGFYAPEKVEASITQETEESLAAKVQERALALHGKTDAVRRAIEGGQA